MCFALVAMPLPPRGVATRVRAIPCALAASTHNHVHYIRGFCACHARQGDRGMLGVFPERSFCAWEHESTALVFAWELVATPVFHLAVF